MNAPARRLRTKRFSAVAAPLLGLAALMGGIEPATACVSAHVVALDQPFFWNRLGAHNPGGMIYALRRDVVEVTSGLPESAGGTLTAGQVMLRPDKRPRPLILRMNAGDCLDVHFQNLLDPGRASTNPGPNPPNPAFDDLDQPASRMAGFHVVGLELVGSLASDASYVGQNANSLVPPGGLTTYTYQAGAEAEGAYWAYSHGATWTSEATGGQAASGLYGAVHVEPVDADYLRSQITEEEMRLASAKSLDPTDAVNCGVPNLTAQGHPIINYDANYPAQNCDSSASVWVGEGKAGLPIIKMLDGTEIVHSDINAIIVGPELDGTFPAGTYPALPAGTRNPTIPNRLEPFREFSSVWQDEIVAIQAFDELFEDETFGFTLHSVRDGFAINYGSGGIGAEIVGNRLGVGPMHDCLGCKYEEFFLSAFTVGDPAMVVDVPADAGVDPITPDPANLGPKATKAYFPADPTNVHHSYINDFVKFRNTHGGVKEHHIFHLHAHQWLFNSNDDNSDYLDSQAIGPGGSYTYEIAYGGSGNRNKVVGDAIFHCHFYPHFAQGMWYLWRNHDVFEAGTQLAASGGEDAFHTVPFGLGDGLPAAGARALPDGEIVAGTPIPALVPMPGKPLPPMPGAVTVAPNPNMTVASALHPDDPDGPGPLELNVPVGSNSLVDRTDVYPVGHPLAGETKNPGYPFFQAGIEHTVGQRPSTPPLDMLSTAQATVLAGSAPLWGHPGLVASAGGTDGGLPRHTLDGVAAGGTATIPTLNRLDFSKEVDHTKAHFFDEAGTDLEQVAMAFHAERCHDTFLPDGAAANCFGDIGGFITNGALPVPGAPYAEPCIDDQGDLFETGSAGDFFGGNGLSVKGTSEFGADDPRVYQAAVIELDVVFNKVGWHYPQQRIITLNEDVGPTLDGTRPPEPFVIRLNTYDCGSYQHTNLVPKVYELDDYQVRTPTDVIGQHIHLVKFDVTSADGAANGWNYEDGTLASEEVQERIAAITSFDTTAFGQHGYHGVDVSSSSVGFLEADEHPIFGAAAGRLDATGARTTIQRWLADPVVNTADEDRGLGIVYTHDHYSPSTHQQVGLYAAVIVEPAGSTWAHNETGVTLGDRGDGGPTSWQATILPQDPDQPAFREFFLEYADFQLAYEKDVYAGRDDLGDVTPPSTASFLGAINPPFRQEANPALPDMVFFPPFCPGGVGRPCAEAISADDPGTYVVNYRNEPLGLRVYDPLKLGPDGELGTQADGLAGDLAFALQTRTDRAIPELNLAPGDAGDALTFGLQAGDPYTPMMRTYDGDLVRVRLIVGAQEEQHNFSIHGVKWLQEGSSFGESPNSGWRNSLATGISEQFALNLPIVRDKGQAGDTADYLWASNASQNGYLNGTWGLLRSYRSGQIDLPPLPGSDPGPGLKIKNLADFDGVCPKDAPVRSYDISAVRANRVLGNALGVVIPANAAPVDNEGGPLDPAGGTLVYNSRPTVIPPIMVGEEGGDEVTIGGHDGPLHDPTAMLYVMTADLEAIDPEDNACFKPILEVVEEVTVVTGWTFDPKWPSCPVQLKAGTPIEPLVLRAAAGECVEVTLRNRLVRGLTDGATGYPLFDADGDPIADPADQVMPDLAVLVPGPWVVHRRDVDGGFTTFNTNLTRPSAHVGIHPQLVEFDVTKSDGANVGLNPVQTAAPAATKKYQWYAGDVSLAVAGGRGGPGVKLVANPVEFGAANLMPADKIEQVQKGLVGALIIEPEGASWDEDPPGPDVATRAAATVYYDGSDFRDFALVFQTAAGLLYADGSPVEGIAGEGSVGIPEDAEDAGASAFNYRTEPLWFRFGVPPHLPFESAREIETAWQAYSNSCCGGSGPAAGSGGAIGDPETPIFYAGAGEEARLRVVHPGGTQRGNVIGVHGHSWQRQPYLSGDVPSDTIGDNPYAFRRGAQEGYGPSQHFDLVLESAGGPDGLFGDYLIRDLASFGNLKGLWALLRVGEAAASGDPPGGGDGGKPPKDCKGKGCNK